MEISAAMVKELRDITGIGMMVCKKALTEVDGNMELAIENLRKQGQVTAEKRAGKAAKEGKVTIVAVPECSIAYEVNTETDFVARNEDFITFIEKLGSALSTQKPANIDAAKSLAIAEFGGLTIEARLTELIGKIGEKITFRRYIKIDADSANERIFSYVHGQGKIGVLVKVSGTAGLDSEDLAILGKDLAMQVAAAKPIAIDRDSVDATVIAKEKEIYAGQAQTSGKPEKIWDKIIEGKLVKFFQETTLLEQAFIKTPDITVTDRIAAVEKILGSKITVLKFIRFELGAEE